LSPKGRWTSRIVAQRHGNVGCVLCTYEQYSKPSRSPWRGHFRSQDAGPACAVPIATGALPGESAAAGAVLLPAVPAAFVILVTARRVTQVRRGAGAFATAPLTPAPPALRAAAAHPLVATPLQVTGLAALAGVPIAAGIVELPGADMAGVVLTAVGVGVLALGIRHAIRHSRLNVAVLAPIGRAGLRALPTMRTSTPAETYAAPPEEHDAAVLALPAERAA